MTTIEKLRTLARELAGEAWDYDRRQLAAQARVRRLAAKAVMKQADAIMIAGECLREPAGGRKERTNSVRAGVRSPAGLGDVRGGRD